MRKVIFAVLALLLFGCREDFGNLIEYNTVSGEVLDEATLEPIADAKITTNPITDLVISDENGRFTLDSLSAKIYGVRVVVEGYNTNLSSFNLDDLENNEVVILMEEDNPQSNPPSIPSSPMPENEAVEQDLDLTLSWSATDDGDSLRYNVYFFQPESQTPSMLLSESLDSSVVVENLRFDRTYRWQVGVTDKEDNEVLGPIWTFQTKSFQTELYRYAFVRNVEGFDQIFVGTEEREEVQVTFDPRNHWRPTLSPTNDQIAYLAFKDGDVHIFSIEKNGENNRQITGSRPFRTKDFLESPFSWADNGNKIIYMDFDQILSINQDGTGLTEIPLDSVNGIITSVDYADLDGGRIIATVEEVSSKSSSMYLLELDNMSQMQILDTLEGQFSHAQFSPSGRQIIFTFNRSNEFSTNGIPLNKRIYAFDLENDIEPTDLSSGKAGGTADTNPRYARSGDFFIFNNGSSDGQGGKASFIVDFEDIGQTSFRDTLFLNSNMLDYQ